MKIIYYFKRSTRKYYFVPNCDDKKRFMMLLQSVQRGDTGTVVNRRVPVAVSESVTGTPRPAPTVSQASTERNVTLPVLTLTVV